MSVPFKRLAPVTKALAAIEELDPLAKSNPDDGFDREKLFILFAQLGGDITRTAHASNLTPSVVLKVVEEEQWLIRLKPILELARSEKKGDVERAISRAISFTQAHRMRLVLDRVVQRFFSMSEQELEDFLFKSETDKDGIETRKLNTRPLADLSSALEKVHVLCYMALSDTATERSKRSEDTSSDSAGELHAVLADAIAKVRSEPPGPTSQQLSEG